MKEENGSSSTGAKNKKAYLYAGIACAAVLLAVVIIVTSIALAARSNKVIVDDSNQASSDINQGELPGEGDDEGDQPVADLPEGFISPLSAQDVINEFGFYHNTTLNIYYEHAGVDFAAAAGTEVYAVDAGTIESIYTSDILVDTQIVIDHGNGIKTVYECVEAKEGLKAGDTVKKGDVIATVAETNGKEYKDGTHLHFEVRENGESVDPAKYLTLEEK